MLNQKANRQDKSPIQNQKFLVANETLLALTLAARTAIRACEHFQAILLTTNVTHLDTRALLQLNFLMFIRFSCSNVREPPNQSHCTPQTVH